MKKINFKEDNYFKKYSLSQISCLYFFLCNILAEITFC